MPSSRSRLSCFVICSFMRRRSNSFAASGYLCGCLMTGRSRSTQDHANDPTTQMPDFAIIRVSSRRGRSPVEVEDLKPARVMHVRRGLRYPRRLVFEDGCERSKRLAFEFPLVWTTNSSQMRYSRRSGAGTRTNATRDFRAGSAI